MTFRERLVGLRQSHWQKIETTIGCLIGPSSVARRSICSPVPEYHYNCFQYDSDIEAERPISQILQIALDATPHRIEIAGLASETSDLGESRNTWSDLVSDHVTLDQLTVLLVVSDGMWAWSDDAHASLQYIDELR